MKRQHGRRINGIVILDKPKGITSNDALQQLKCLYSAQKAGHTGSLDPMATGVLPICFGEATKFSQYLLDADKQYRTTVKLGIKTASGDADGEVLETSEVPELNRNKINSVIDQCTGSIEQIPSMYSALKHKGQPLYKLARQGVTVERKARRVQIYNIELLSINGNDEFEISVHCSKGTYIRTLAEDMGEMLGCGAHLIALRRIKSGPYAIDKSKTLKQLIDMQGVGGHALLDEELTPIASALDNMSDVYMSAALVGHVQQGQAIFVPQSPMEGMVRLFQEEGDFLGIGEVLDDGRIQPRRLIVTTEA